MPFFPGDLQGDCRAAEKKLRCPAWLEFQEPDKYLMWPRSVEPLGHICFLELIYVFMCVSKNTHIHIYVYTSMYTCLWRPEDNLGCGSSGAFHPISSSQSASLRPRACLFSRSGQSLGQGVLLCPPPQHWDITEITHSADLTSHWAQEASSVHLPSTETELGLQTHTR